MAGTPLVVGVLAVTTSLAMGVAAVGAASVSAVRAGTAADAAGLAAADTVMGVASGTPCERAAETANLVGVELEACVIEQATATVTVALPVGPFVARAQARAGPPP